MTDMQKNEKVVQFTHAKETVGQLSNSLDHMKKKWDLFRMQNYLPETDVFLNINKELDALLSLISRMEKSYIDVKSGTFIRPVGTVDKNLQKYQLQLDYITREDFETLKIDQLCNCELSDDDLKAIVESKVLKSQLIPLHYIKDTIYDRVEEISDMLNAVNYCFNSRMSGIISPETASFSKDISTKKFSGIQLVYDSAETLMKDYYESFVFGSKYNGLVVFGFRNRALAHPTSITVFPTYAEHDLEYLTILAHESFHIYHNQITASKKLPAPQRNLNTSDESLRTFNGVEEKLNRIFLDIVDIYNSENYKDRNTPEIKIADEITSEIMADIYATYVAGVAYPKMLYDYYIPIICDIKTDPTYKKKYSTFRIGSLKLRVSLATIRLMNKRIGDPNVKATSKKLFKKLESWEQFSLNAANIQGSRNPRNGESLITVIAGVCREIENSQSIADMGELITNQFYPSNVSGAEIERVMGQAEAILAEKPGCNSVHGIWDLCSDKKGDTGEKWFKPRHLISRLAMNPRLNRNAILIALAHHDYITRRYTGGV